MIAPLTFAGRQSRLSDDTPNMSRQRIAYIKSDEFKTLTLDQLLSEAPQNLYQEEQSTDEPNDPASSTHSDLNHRRLLTTEGERHLFRQMNFCKYEASRLQAVTRSPRSGRNLSTFAASQHRQSASYSIDALLKLADEARRLLVQGNMRLVTSIANKTTNSQQDRDEYISEGNLILVNAIDKFDYSRGFRFSTYATHAIQRHFYRLMQRKQKRQKREVLSPVEFLSNACQPVSTEDQLDPKLAKSLIARFDDCLTPREKAIITERFGLNGQESATLKTVADRVGLSKERVRQLQLSAIEKLQDLVMQMQFRKEAFV